MSVNTLGIKDMIVNQNGVSVLMELVVVRGRRQKIKTSKYVIYQVAISAMEKVNHGKVKREYHGQGREEWKLVLYIRRSGKACLIRLHFRRY